METKLADIQEYVDRGVALFKQGYNCSQSVAMAFADYYNVDPMLMSRLAGSFGGGIGRMRETCGAACGMFMLAGLEVTANGELYPDAELKKRNYQAVQDLAAAFRSQTGSLLCRELLNLNKQRLDSAKQHVDGTVPNMQICSTPEPRTEEYYRQRPCLRMVETAIRLYYQFLIRP